jgi:hypothetical protein
MELTDEVRESIKEDIRKGLSPKQICMKYHISPAQYGEVKNSISSLDHTEENRPVIIERHRRKRNVSFLGLIFFALFVFTLSFTMYKKATGPALGLGIFMALAFGFMSLMFFVMEV